MEEVDMTKLLAFRQELKPESSISVAAFFIKALAIALKDYPIFNSELDEEKGRILLKDSVHMGVATDTPEGLIVPVIRNAEGKSLLRYPQKDEITSLQRRWKTSLQERRLQTAHSPSATSDRSAVPGRHPLSTTRKSL